MTPLLWFMAGLLTGIVLTVCTVVFLLFKDLGKD